MRRKNHIARDLRTPKYAKRVVPTKRVKDEPWDPMKWLEEMDKND